MELIILIGIPASGKSSLSKNYDAKIVSTDQIRGFLFGNESIVEHDDLIFKVAKDIVLYFLKQKWNVILDATNTKKERRKEFTSIGRKVGAKIKFIWVNCPLEIALDRNSERERKVPVKVIYSLYKGLESPDLGEDVDEIEIRDENMDIIERLIRG